MAILRSGQEGSAGCSSADSATCRWWAPAGIVVMVMAAYFPAIHGDFILSDHNVLVDNPRLIEAGGVKRIWWSMEGEQYQPLTTMSYWLERSIWGLHPLGYHIVNIVLHSINAILVWLLLTRLRVRGALVASMIFALHPVNTESVAWIYERKNILSGLFFFASLACLIRLDDQRSRVWYVAGLLLFVCALLSKASTVILPPILLLYWWLQKKTWDWRRVACIIPFFTLAGLMAVLTIFYERFHTGVAELGITTGFAERFARAGWIIVFYLSKLLLPHNLIFIYPRWSADPTAITSYLPHLVLLAVLVVLGAYRTSWGRPVLFALGYYLLALFPVLGFFDIYYHRLSFVADHFQYLASVGMIALCVHTAVWLFDSIGQRRYAGPTTLTLVVPRVLGVIVIVICFFLTFHRAGMYKNFNTLARNTLRRNPDCWFMHYKRGEYLLNTRAGPLRRKALARAIIHFEHALRIKPDDEGSLVNMGGALGMLNRPRQAVKYLHRAVSVNPNNPLSRYSLGLAYLRSDQVDRAIVEFEEALRLQPDMAVAHYSLGKALCEAGRFDEGIEHFGEALHINPKMPAAAAAMRKANRSVQKRALDRPAGR